MPSSPGEGKLYNTVINTIIKVEKMFYPQYQLNNITNKEIRNLDKMVHFSLYFLLSLLFFSGFGLNKKMLLILILFAFFDELHQIPIPGRTFSLFDWFFDILGTIFVYNSMRL